MGGFDFDRQVFVKSSEEKPQRTSSSLLNSLIWLAVIALGAFALYRYLPTAARLKDGADKASLAQIQKRLDEMNKRLTLIEKRQRGLRAMEHSRRNKSVATTTANSFMPVSHRQPVREAPADAKMTQAQAARSPVATAQSALSGGGRQKILTSTPSNATANQEEWEATANRLGDVVGVLGEQDKLVSQNQKTLAKLLDGTPRSLYPFTLLKGKRHMQQVGPVRLWLQSMNAGAQRYTLWLLINDRWVQLKDRASNEDVELHLPGSQSTAQLVVSQIGSDQVSGKLLVSRPRANP